MRRIKTSFEPFLVFSYLLKWTLLVIPVSVTAGSLVALFLWLLDKALDTRLSHPWLLYFLPMAGLLIYLLYRLAGKNAEAGNNLIIEEIHDPGEGVPVRMAPLVLVTTVITHLFGGSAGREGTAVQIGGSMAQWLAKITNLSKADVQILLMTGIAAGFGAVFGTPVAGTLFALEVLALGQIRYNALLPCLMAAVLADQICAAWGIHHTAYHIHLAAPVKTYFSYFHFDFALLLTIILAGVLFGQAGFLFARLTDKIKEFSNQWIRVKWMIPVLGGLIVIGLTRLLGTEEYLGLGVYNPDPQAVSILSSFHAGGATAFSWLWKLLFTAITIGMGFKGGEVTPLFFIGAALGNTLATLTGAPVDLLAGLGFIAVFAGATNTPVACTLMGVELFGGEYILYYAVACFTAYYFSGHSGIYSAQKVSGSKVSNGWIGDDTTKRHAP